MCTANSQFHCTMKILLYEDQYTFSRLHRWIIMRVHLYKWVHLPSRRCAFFMAWIPSLQSISMTFKPHSVPQLSEDYNETKCAAYANKSVDKLTMVDFCCGVLLLIFRFIDFDEPFTFWVYAGLNLTHPGTSSEWMRTYLHWAAITDVEGSISITIIIIIVCCSTARVLVQYK